jgi:hypothetical protein
MVSFITRKPLASLRRFESHFRLKTRQELTRETTLGGSATPVVRRIGGATSNTATIAVR